MRSPAAPIIIHTTQATPAARPCQSELNQWLNTRRCESRACPAAGRAAHHLATTWPRSSVGAYPSLVPALDSTSSFRLEFQ